MKYLALGFLLLTGSLSAFAEGKIAVVNFELAVFNTDIVKAKVQALQADPTYKKNMQEIQAIQDDGKKLIEKVKKEGPTMSAAQKQQAEADMKSKQSDLEHLAGKLKDAEAAALQSTMYQMQAQAINVAKEIIAAEGIGLLLNASAQSQNVIHADTSFDITPKVTDKLNKLNTKKP
jgi:outer membrane protein